MRNVKRNITDKIDAFRWYKCRPRIDGYVMQNVIGNITNPLIGIEKDLEYFTIAENRVKEKIVII